MFQKYDRRKLSKVLWYMLIWALSVLGLETVWNVEKLLTFWLGPCALTFWINCSLSYKRRIFSMNLKLNSAIGGIITTSPACTARLRLF